jgi:hypothetical protein
VDATLARTAVGSAAGVAGVAVAVVATVVQARSDRNAGPKVTAELGAGQLAHDGVLCVEFASGNTDVMRLPAPGSAKTSMNETPGKEDFHDLEYTPVNAIFVCNQGRTAVTVSRCHYVSGLGGMGFRFEPQPAASPRGNHLPKRLRPGEDAVLLHDWATMRAFLNWVLRDYQVDAAVFEAVLTLGDGSEVAVSPALQVRTDMTEQELAAFGPRLVRQEIAWQHALVSRTIFGRRPLRRSGTRS